MELRTQLAKVTLPKFTERQWNLPPLPGVEDLVTGSFSRLERQVNRVFEASEPVKEDRDLISK
jgi:hypothetical protein